MPNEDELLAGAGLPVWFRTYVSPLVGAIRRAGDGSAPGEGMGHAAHYVAQIRRNAVAGAPGLESALAAVGNAVARLERGASEEAHADAIAALGRLAMLLRDVEPSDVARAVHG